MYSTNAKPLQQRGGRTNQYSLASLRTLNDLLLWDKCIVECSAGTRIGAILDITHLRASRGGGDKVWAKSAMWSLRCDPSKLLQRSILSWREVRPFLFTGEKSMFQTNVCARSIILCRRRMSCSNSPVSHGKSHAAINVTSCAQIILNRTSTTC